MRIRSQEVSYPASLSPGAADFIRRALVRSPEQRTSMADLLAHPWLRGHMSRAAAPHARGRAATQGEVSAGLGMLLPASAGGGGGGGGGASGPGAMLGVVAAAAPGSLSLPGTTGAGAGGIGVGSWGAARMRSSGGAGKGGPLAGALPAGAGEGHNSSCPNILHAQVGHDALRLGARRACMLRLVESPERMTWSARLGGQRPPREPHHAAAPPPHCHPGQQVGGDGDAPAPAAQGLSPLGRGRSVDTSCGGGAAPWQTAAAPAAAQQQQQQQEEEEQRRAPGPDTMVL
jgi:hypothetical protein